jgi:hypothetical protein
MEIVEKVGLDEVEEIEKSLKSFFLIVPFIIHHLKFLDSIFLNSFIVHFLWCTHYPTPLR